MRREKISFSFSDVLCYFNIILFDRTNRLSTEIRETKIDNQGLELQKENFTSTVVQKNINNNQDVS